MLKNLPVRKLEETIQTELLSLTRKPGHDYGYNPEMPTGYAILSFVDTDKAVKVLILQVPNLSSWRPHSR
jgi:hypothetical protein